MKNTFSGWRYLWKSQDIRRKLLMTLLILVIYRLAANIPVPGIDGNLLKQSPGKTDWFICRLPRHALRWYGIELLPAIDGCLSVHYRPDHHPVTGPHLSGSAAQDAGRSSRRYENSRNGGPITWLFPWQHFLPSVRSTSSIPCQPADRSFPLDLPQACG